VTVLTSPQFEGLQDAYVAVEGQIADHTEYMNAPRGNASHECLNMGFTLTNPISRVPFLAARKINIVFHFAKRHPTRRSAGANFDSLRGRRLRVELWRKAGSSYPTLSGTVWILL
jgi:hypothetical protein